MNSRQQRILDALAQHAQLGIATQHDYDKLSLYSIIAHSTAIEGSTLTDLEAQLLFDNDITSGNRTMTEHLMNLDLRQAYHIGIQMMTEHRPLSTDMLCQLSAAVMRNTGTTYNTAVGTFDSAAGNLRLVNVTAGIGGRSYMNYTEVPAAVEQLCHKFNQRREALQHTDDVIEKYMTSFEAHYDLVVIHPWVDGNGRMARLLMNMLQYEAQLLPVRVEREHKAQYIESLLRSREAKSSKPFTDFMLDEHYHNLSREIDRATHD